MIQSLSIRNIALIDHLDLEFHSGLQVLTGETGAGKSIVVDSVILILGGRADRSMIRSGCEKASVEAVFDISSNPKGVSETLQRESIEFDGVTVTVYREISQSGKNLCRICGVLMPLAYLREIAPMLMNLHGQSETQFLSDAHTHIAYLDQMGDAGHLRIMEEVRTAYRGFISNHREYARLVKQGENREMRMEKIGRDLEELRAASLLPGEEEMLTAQIRQMQNTEKISSGLRKAANKLTNGDDNGESIQSVREAARILRPLAPYEPTADHLADKCESLYYELEEVAFQINKLLDGYDDDPGKLERAENRLELIRRLEKRYGATEEAVLSSLASMETEYDELQNLEGAIEHMGQQHKSLLAEYRAAARRLTESRMNLAHRFESAMMKELSDLGMGQTVFQVAFRKNDGPKPKMPTENGDDEAEFLISPNPGEPLMPLAKIASGGELSRLMLAMKVLEAGHTGIDTMVFDEIDTGISGRMAQIVAEKMIMISRHHQVICVSHLPQLAAAGDYQYLVSKGIHEGRTLTGVTELDRTGRIAEVARMISGADGVSEEAASYAEMMLLSAENRKKAMQSIP